MPRRLDWTTEGKDWPNRAHSRFVAAGGLRWHVQRAGRGDGVLLLHGTGASTHSWMDLFPLVSRRFDTLALDLPGQGFTQPLGGLDASLPGMVRAVKALLVAEAFRPAWVIGHSAGAAIAVSLASGLAPPLRGVISLNGALKPFGGPAALIAPLMAKALAANPLVRHALAHAARDPARVTRVIRGTGSDPGKTYLELYGRLLGNPAHVSATLSMMANWDVSGILPSFERAGIPLHQIIGELDRAVPPDDAEALARRHAQITAERLAGLGHLAHEEDAPRVAAAIFAAFAENEQALRKVAT